MYGLKISFHPYYRLVVLKHCRGFVLETFRRETIVPIHWVYPIPKPDVEKDVSPWTETIQERFQTAYAGIRERQQQTVRRNAQYYKRILNQFNIGQWVWIFDPKIIPGSCVKLRSYWAGPYNILRLMAVALPR